MNLGRDFQHLLSVARLAARRGNARPAEVMLASYRAEAERLVSRPDEADVPREKARFMAAILASVIDDVRVLPNPADDPPPAFAAAKPKAKDPVNYMKLTAGEARAVREIRAIHEATVKALQPHAPPPDAIKVDAGRKDFDPWRFFSEKLAVARKTRYLPWVARNRKLQAVPSRLLTLGELAFAVLLEGRSLRRIEDDLELGSGRLSEPFRVVLRDYWR